MNFNFYDNSKMNNVISNKTAKLIMDMALFTMIQTYMSFGYDTEYIVSKADEMQEDVRNCFMAFCEMNGIEGVEDKEAD